MNAKCPSDEVMADYLEGVLPDAAKFELETHIADCDICLDTITEGNRLLRGGGIVETDPVPAHVTQRAVDAVRHQAAQRQGAFGRWLGQSTRSLVEKIGNVVLVPTAGDLYPAPIRGSVHQLDNDRVLLKKTFTEIDTEIEMERTAAGTTHIRVFLVGDSANETGIRVSIQQTDREVSSQLIDGGYAVFEDVSFDQYRLVFTRSGNSIGAYAFELKETMND